MTGPSPQPLPADGDASLAGVIARAETLAAAGQIVLAAQEYGGWIAGNAGHPQGYAAHFNQAALLAALNDGAGAKAALEQAIALNPDFHPAYERLVGMLESDGALDQTVQLLNRQLSRLEQVTPANLRTKTAILGRIATLFDRHGLSEVAERLWRQSVELDSGLRRNMENLLLSRMRHCRWPVIEPFDGMDAAAQLKSFAPLALAAYTDDPLLHLAATRNRIVQVRGYRVPRLPPVEPAARPDRTRLRIGYLSSDLREHAIGYLMAEMFALHDRSRVEVFAYYSGPVRDDPLKARIRQGCDHWHDISAMTDDQAARRIRDDGIDILVDLNGHTAGARIELVGRCPAPINVNWLGCPASMATPYHHYLIADDWVVPPGQEFLYTEKVVRLPCYQPNDRNRGVDAGIPARADAGLPETAMVYGCFCTSQKITPAMFDRWMAILSAVPGSVLWLLEIKPEVHERLWRHAERHGIGPERIIPGSRLFSSRHLARLPLADLFLDTFPYGSHTTASDALWMGVPILTLSGLSFASRVCGSLVRSAGLPELVCPSPQHYVDAAIALGGEERGRLRGYRERLRTGRQDAVMFDTDLLVDHLEGLYAGMWADFQNGRLPSPDLRNLGTGLDAGTSLHPWDGDFIQEDEYLDRWRQRLGELDLMEPSETPNLGP